MDSISALPPELLSQSLFHCAREAGLEPATPQLKVEEIPIYGTSFVFLFLERMNGIEPSSSVWRTDALPLCYIRKCSYYLVVPAGVEPAISTLKVWRRNLFDLSTITSVRLEGLEPSRSFPLDFKNSASTCFATVVCASRSCCCPAKT